MRTLMSMMLIFLVSYWSTGGLKAAVIERYADDLMGCSMLLSGQIVDGDAAKLEALVADILSEDSSREVGRVCFNSPGGSFLEGVRLAQSIRGISYLGTAIGDGHICESACAVAFMAGGWTEGGYDSVRPIMHPRSRLGFHAPSVEVPSGQYSEAQVKEAWNVALLSISQLLEMRARAQNVSDMFNFPDQLMVEMISTPPDSMFYIDTVERAAIFEIAVFPVGVNSLSPSRALTNICMMASGWMTSGPERAVNIRLEKYDEVTAYFESGFGEEAVGSCRVSLRRDALVNVNVFRHSRDRPVFIEWDGSELGGGPSARQSGAFPYMMFDASTRLEALPVEVEQTWEEFITRIQYIKPRTSQCWLNAPIARITNVNEYVNLRRRPDFNAPVIREVPLGEQVRPTQFDNVMITGGHRSYDACVNACQAYSRSPIDRPSEDRVQKCIDDNMLWYEITDARGNRGWVSRRFLEEVQ